MRLEIKNIASRLINNYLIILLSVFVLTLISGVGLNNFKLDASSDALVLGKKRSISEDLSRGRR